VSFPDFPGCVTAGRTSEEARRRAAEALSFHIAGMVEDGEKIPNLCFARTKSAFEMNNVQREDATLLHALWLAKLQFARHRPG
jgi:predicted RNase H-like HicB family nuclease